MKSVIIFCAIQVFMFTCCSAQSLSINSDGSSAHNSAMLDVKSSIKGVLIPRLTRAERDAIASPATGLLIFQHSPDSVGFYYYTGSRWTWVFSNANSDSLAWRTGGNTNTGENNFIGTLDDVPLKFRVNNLQSGKIDRFLKNVYLGVEAGNMTTIGTENTAYGHQALLNNTDGSANTAIGAFTLFSNANGGGNTAIGHTSLVQNLDGRFNVAVGYKAMFSNTSGSWNTAAGDSALLKNTSGHYNIAGGHRALFSNLTGQKNIAIGLNALYANSTGSSNTAVGDYALFSNSEKSNLVALGDSALFYNGTGSPIGVQASKNTAVGSKALHNNSTGYANTALGSLALYNCVTGYLNTAVGSEALYSNVSGNSCTAVGSSALRANTTGSANSAFGNDAFYNNTTGSQNTAIGSSALRGNSTGMRNTGTGSSALDFNTTGNDNTALGYFAARPNTTGIQNTAVGANALVNNSTGSYHTAVGYNTGPNTVNLDNTSCFGIDARATATDQVRIGNIFVNSIGGQVGWTTLSDGRFKEEVNEPITGLAFILKLRPVQYLINRQKLNAFLGVSPSVQREVYSDFTTGFIAQEVEQAALQTGFSFSGIDKPKNDFDYYGLRYAEFVVPLVKAVQEQQEMIKSQAREIADMKVLIKSLAKQ